MRNLFIALILLIPGSINAQERIWKNDGSDAGAIHALGNGSTCVYELGPNIVKIYPGPLSTPSMFTLTMAHKDPLETRSFREPGTAVWGHNIFRDGRTTGYMQDFVDAELPVLIRHLNLADEIQFHLKLNPAISVLELTADAEKGWGGMLLMAPVGTKIYQKYVYPRPLFYKISWKGNISIDKMESGENNYLVSCGTGEGDNFFTGGPEYDEAIENTERAINTGPEEMLKRTRVWWQDFTEKRIDFEKELPQDLPLRKELLQTIDDFSVMIKTQQAREGSIMAGYPYPLGYVRDQYGASRGLLALGYYEEARDILDFYWNVWKKTGELHCAQGIGVDGIFHIHENDEVESPAYLIMQAFDLQEKSGDRDYTRKIFPMLEWCWEVQKKHLAGYMLPFNGDETYIAGGILPRSTLNDGSSEATLLFIDGGGKLLEWIEMEGLWPSARREENRKLLTEVSAHFRENFWDGSTLVTNNPSRLNYTDPPRFRHGVCERRGPDCLIAGKGGFGGIDWTEKDLNNRYQCPVCLALGPLPAAEGRTYKLISVSLTPLYFDSGLLETEELAPLVRQVYENYHRTGILTSRTGPSAAKENKRCVGYDYGLILNAMLETDHEDAEEIYRKTLSIVDETGAWSEYYINEIPSGTRCRPWESAINLEALIKFARKTQYETSILKVP